MQVCEKQGGKKGKPAEPGKSGSAGFCVETAGVKILSAEAPHHEQTGKAAACGGKIRQLPVPAAIPAAFSTCA
jgi:hypothetical protein